MTRPLIFRLSHCLMAVCAMAVMVLWPRVEAPADIRYRAFRDDSSRFETYVDRAKSEATLEDWDRAVKRGIASLRAEWERDADFRMAAELRAVGDTAENRARLSLIRDEARTLWEKDAESAGASARGAWYACRMRIARLGFDELRLKAELTAIDAGASGLFGRMKVDAWDADAAVADAAVRASWEQSLGSLLAELRADGKALDEESRKSYERELCGIERELRDRFRLEKNSLVYSHRNRIIRDSLVDHESLRYARVAESASAIADEVLSGVRTDLSKIEKRILSTGSEGHGEAPAADFTQLGSDWERQIRELLEEGLSRWSEAREELAGRMAAWKQESDRAYNDGDEAWRTAYERLFEAQMSWQKEMERELASGIEAWRERDRELSENLDRAKRDLEAYLDTAGKEWMDNAAGLRDMALSGAKVYGDALDNLTWLDSMVSRYKNKGAYSAPVAGSPDYRASWLRYQEKLKSEFSGNIEAFIARNKSKYNYSGEVEGLSISAVLLSTPTISADGATVTETYEITISGVFGYSKSGSGFLRLETPNNVTEKFIWSHVMGENTPGDKKSEYYFYVRERVNWLEMKETFGDLAAETERSVHYAAMLGMGGPGYLTNAAGEFAMNGEGVSDPYLMTEAEFQYALAGRELDYWSRRLAIAEDVLKYACPDSYEENEFAPQGLREAASVTVTRKEEAERLLEVSRRSYREGLEAVEALVGEMKKIQGEKPITGADEDTEGWAAYRMSIEYLSRELEKKRGELEKAEEDYQKYALACIVLENGQGAEFMKKEIAEIQSSLLAIEKSYYEKRSAYISALASAEHADRLEEFSEVYIDALYGRLEARRSLMAISEIVKGEETKESVALWAEKLCDESTREELWEGRDEAYEAMAGVYLRWLNAPDDDATRAVGELADMIRREYLTRQTIYFVRDEIFSRLSGTSFDPTVYREKYEEIRGDALAGVLKRYSHINTSALEAVGAAMDTLEKKDGAYDALLRALKDTGAFTYEGNNEAFLTKKSALAWASANMEGLSAETWDALKAVWEQSLENARRVESMYDDFQGFREDLDAWLMKASDPDEGAEARMLLEEFRNPGSMIEALEVIRPYDNSLDAAIAFHDFLGDFTARYGQIFPRIEWKMRHGDHLGGLVHFINMNNGQGFSIDGTSTEGLEAEELAEAARLIINYVMEGGAGFMDLPKSLAVLGIEIKDAVRELEELLYVRAHANDTDFRERSEDANRRLSVASGACEHLGAVAEVLSGLARPSQYAIAGEAYARLRTVLDRYDALDAPVRDYFAAFESGPVKEYAAYCDSSRNLAGYYEAVYHALSYMELGGGIGFEEYLGIACSSISAEARERIRQYILENCYDAFGGFPEDELERALISERLFAVAGELAELMEHEAAYGYSLLSEAEGFLSGEWSSLAEEASRAAKLVAYHDRPDLFLSYRNSLMGASEMPDGSGPALELHPLYGYNIGYDERVDGGRISALYLSPADEMGRQLGSMIIESSNRLSRLVAETFVAARQAGGADEETATVEAFLQRVRSVYNPGEDYGYAGSYAFDGDIAMALAEAGTMAADRGSRSLEVFFNELSYLGSLMDSRKTELIGLSSALGEVGDIHEARKGYETAAKLRDEHQRAYASLAESLAKAGADYRDAHNAYVRQMDSVAVLYRDVQNKEFAYERAFAVWEYANTPYLSDTAAREGDTGTAVLPDGTLADLDAAPPPDARERFASVSLKYDEAKKAFDEAKNRYDVQETLADLIRDAKYLDARSNFEESARRSARTLRACDILEEETASLLRECAEWSEKYARAKEADGGFNRASSSQNDGGDSGAMSEEEIARRDLIIAHAMQYVRDHGGDEIKQQDGVASSAGIDAYIAAVITENSLLREIEKYETEYEFDWSSDSYVLLKNYDPSGYNSALAAYEAFNPIIKSDMQYLRDRDLNYSELIEKMSVAYRNYTHWEAKYKEADRKRRGCAKLNIICKKRWEKKRNERRGKYQRYLGEYNAYRTQLVNYLRGIMTARNNLASIQSNLNSINLIRSARELREKVLSRPFLAMTDEDRSLVYDSMDGWALPLKGGMDISSLRKKARRTDVDGRAVEAVIGEADRRVDGTDVKVRVIHVLDRDNAICETYELDDISIILTSDMEGTAALKHSDLAVGTRAFVTDYVYSAAQVITVLKEAFKKQREEDRNAYEGYVSETASSGEHDRTVLLRDAEALYFSLLEHSAKLGVSAGEKKPRSYEGYAVALNELVSNGRGTSAGDKIVKALLAQNRAFNEQNRAHLRQTFDDKYLKWRETAAYIRTRGERDWADNLYAMENAWRKWRVDTKAAMARGEEDWEKAHVDLQARQDRWMTEASSAGADAAAEMLSRDIGGLIRNSVEDINASLPKSLALDFDAESLYRSARKKIPEIGLGALAKSMTAAITTAGISDVLSLGLKGDLAERFSTQMDAFEKSMSVMKNLRMGEVVFTILDGFGEQLSAANEHNYLTVMSGLAVYYNAPFIRDGAGRQWNIRVVRDHSLTGTRFRTIRFADYQDFMNTTIKLKNLKTVNGGTVDFNDPGTYNLIDTRELEIYVRLETDHLTREIDRVFGNGGQGLFALHSKDEFARLQNDFNNAYSDYLIGEAKLGGPWYRTPIFRGGPDPMTAAKIGSAIAGPWAAFAVNAAMLAVDTKDGVIAGKHALLQGAVGFAAGLAGPGGGFLVNLAASGIDYESGGGIGWDNSAFREGALRNMSSYALSSALGGVGRELLGKDSLLAVGLTSGFSESLMSSVSFTSNGWSSFNLDFDRSNLREHLVKGAASGITSMAIKSMSEKGLLGTEMAQRDHAASVFTSDGFASLCADAGNAFSMKTLSGGLNSMLMTATYRAMDGKGFKNDYSRMNWGNMTMSVNELGNFFGSQANTLLKSRQGYDANIGGYDDKKKVSSGMAEDMLGAMLKYSDEGDKYARNFFDSIGSGLVKMTVDSIMGLYTPKLVREINFRVARDDRNEITKESVVSIIKELGKDENFKEILESDNNRLNLKPGEKWLLKTIADEMSIVEVLGSKIKDDGKDKLGGLSHEEVIQYVNTKSRLFNAFGLMDTINSKDLEMLQYCLRQSISKDGYDKNGPIVQNVFDIVKANPNVFGGDYDGIKRDTKFRNVYTGLTEKLDLKSDKSILNFSQSVGYNSCLLVSTYANMVLSGMYGVPPSFGDFYLKGYTSRISDEKGARFILDHINRAGTDQNLVDKIVGGSNILQVVKIEGDGSRILEELKSRCTGELFNARIEIQCGDIKTGTYKHYMLASSIEKGIMELKDMGRPKIPEPRENVNIFNKKQKLVTEANVQSAVIFKTSNTMKFYDY